MVRSPPTPHSELTGCKSGGRASLRRAGRTGSTTLFSGGDIRRTIQTTHRGFNRKQKHYAEPARRNFSSTSNKIGGLARCAGAPLAPTRPKPSPYAGPFTTHKSVEYSAS